MSTGYTLRHGWTPPELRTPHAPHTVYVYFYHDCLGENVAMAHCTQGLCPQTLTQRLRAAGLAAFDTPPDPEIDFWPRHRKLSLLAWLRLAQHEGRSATAERLRNQLLDLERNRL